VPFFCTTLTHQIIQQTKKIPQTLTDRYARINHGFTDHCDHLVPKPLACTYGSDDAQSAAAWSHVGLSALLLLVSPIISSLSDIHGRKPAILLALIVSCIPAFVFYLIVVRPDMNPAWYYVSDVIEDYRFICVQNYNNIFNITIFSCS
jgi:MFS family permease